MDYAKFKVRQMQRQVATPENIVGKVIFNLKNLTAIGGSYLTEGASYTCTLSPVEGYYLPQTITIAGCSIYQYDYITGVINIPFETIILDSANANITGDITITAIASEIPTDVPAVLEVSKMTSDTYDGTTSYTGEKFILLYIGGSGLINVTYGGLTKTLQGSGRVFFGTYNGVTDEIETPDSGTLTISGSYTSFGGTTYDVSSGSKSTTKGNSAECIESVINWGVITSINSESFKGSSIPGTIEFPSTLKSIGAAAFQECTQITSVNIPESVTSMTSNSSTGGAFQSCSNLKSVILSPNIKTVGYNAFKGCVSLNSIIIPNGVEEIASDALASCSSLETINIPKSVTKIHGSTGTPLGSTTRSDCSGSFYYCTKLANIYIDEQNEKYLAENGMIFNKEKTELVACPAATGNFIVPDGVQTIGMFALNSTSITNLTIPSSVTKIQSGTKQSTLTTITVLATTVPKLDVASANGISHIGSNVTTIIVPAGCGEKYKAAAEWSYDADKIVEASV